MKDENNENEMKDIEGTIKQLNDDMNADIVNTVNKTSNKTEINQLNKEIPEQIGGNRFKNYGISNQHNNNTMHTLTNTIHTNHTKPTNQNTVKLTNKIKLLRLKLTKQKLQTKLQTKLGKHKLMSSKPKTKNINNKTYNKHNKQTLRNKHNKKTPQNTQTHIKHTQEYKKISKL